MGYKKDQGRMARMAAFWTLIVLLFYGCNSLQQELVIRFPGSLGRAFGAIEGQPRSGFHLPIIGVGMSPAFLVALLVFAGGFVLIYRWLERPKYAELLIETETELRKVTWPTLPEAIDGSVVVIATVLFLMVFLAGMDWVLGRWAVFFFTSGS